MDRDTETQVRRGDWWRTAWRRFRALSGRRTASFYLILALFVVVTLSMPMILYRDDPRRFALFMILLFVFCFVAISRAIVDAFEILRDHFKAKEEAFRTTLGDKEFAKELGKRVSERDRGESWPE